MSHFESIKLIGEGGYAKVYSAYDPIKKKNVAIKVIIK